MDDSTASSPDAAAVEKAFTTLERFVRIACLEDERFKGFDKTFEGLHSKYRAQGPDSQLDPSERTVLDSLRGERGMIKTSVNVLTTAAWELIEAIREDRLPYDQGHYRGLRMEMKARSGPDPSLSRTMWYDVGRALKSLTNNQFAFTLANLCQSVVTEAPSITLLSNNFSFLASIANGMDQTDEGHRQLVLTMLEPITEPLEEELRTASTVLRKMLGR